jgi:hypothetical protein
MTSNHSLPKFTTEAKFKRGTLIGATEAEAVFIEAGLELLEPYGQRGGKKSGPSSWPLRARCTHCGYEGKRSLMQLTYHGNACVALDNQTNGRVTGCLLTAGLEEFRAYGLEPVDWSTYQSTETEVECRCTTCGTTGGVSLARIRASVGGMLYRQPCFRGSPCDKARPRRTCPEGCECNRHLPSVRRLDPQVAAEEMRAVGFEPLEPYPGTEFKWECRHSCGAVVRVRHHNTTRTNLGYCVECKKISASRIAALLETKELEPLDPSQLNGGATGLIDCVHLPCGETTRVDWAHLKDRSDTRVGSGGCATCAKAKSGRAQWTSRVDWEKAAEKGQMTLLGETGPSKVPVLCRCNRCGHSKPTWYNTLRKGGGCGPCNLSAAKQGQPTHGCGGFKKNQRGILYLMSDRQGTLKVGITSTKNKYFRIQTHKFHGWYTVKTWEAPGRAVMRREQDVLRWWRDTLSAPMVKTAEDMPQGGWTETASTRKVGLQRTIDYIEELAA